MALSMCVRCATTLTNSPRNSYACVSHYLFLKIRGTGALVPTSGYAKKAAKGKGAGAKTERLYDILQVNTDPKYLVENCAGSNYFKEGTDVELKPDEEYPDWLWDIHTGPAIPLEELDPETPKYWRRLRKMHMKRNNRLSKGKKF
ncbi:large ribosomal subunit protein mL54-like [Diadema antillarum]|uniref:large ribosomal subunit protein mL54-like n=1 Tax=Diadema antillarum TaxID=105358 RepID=UPI003A88E67D